MAAFFYAQAMEERTHAMMMVQYLLDTDQPVHLPAIAAPVSTFEGIVAPVELAVEQGADGVWNADARAELEDVAEAIDARLGVIDEDVAHEPGGEGDDVGAVCNVDPAEPDEAQDRIAV